MRTSDSERGEIRIYFEMQDFGEPTHLEKVGSDRVTGVEHDIWDVRCANGRWWAVRNPLDAYSLEGFKSRDVVLIFHFGLALKAVDLIVGSWRRLARAVDALRTAREAHSPMVSPTYRTLDSRATTLPSDVPELEVSMEANWLAAMRFRISWAWRASSKRCV